MIGTTISHYKILEKLGSGGMGDVWKAEDSKLGRPVALKLLAPHLLRDEEARKRFQREAQAAAALSHPNVTTIYEIDEADGKTFLALEYVEGETLEQRIEQGPLPLHDALDIARQTAEGLQAAHAKGIVHRDIKPGNVLITPYGRVKILDFGLAQLTERSKLTQLDTTVGTVAYMSPEQSQGSGTDHRTDIWALGVLLYEMVTGQQPFKGDYDKAVMYSILNEEPEPPTGLRTGVPVEIEILVGKCLAKSPDDRYQRAEELDVDLRAARRRLEIGSATPVTEGSSISPATGAPAESSNRSSSLAIGVLATLCVALAGYAAYITWGSALRTRQAVRHFTIELDQPASHTAISPDGRYVAFVTGIDTGGALWVQDLATGERRRVEAAGDVVLYPFWSRDSSSLAYFTRGGLYRLALDGGTPQLLSELIGSGASLAGLGGGGCWTPDGSQIIFADGHPNRLFRVNARGGSPEPLFDQERFGVDDRLQNPRFALDDHNGRRVFFTVFDVSDGSVVLMSVDLDAGDVHEAGETGSNIVIAEDYLVHSARGGGLRWRGREAESEGADAADQLISENGNYPGVSNDGTLVYVGGDPGPEQLVFLDRRGVQVGTIGQAQDAIDTPRFSPDGSVVAVSGREGNRIDVWIQQVARAIKTRATFGTVGGRRPVWFGQTGDLVFSSSRRDGDEAIYLTAADGSGDAQLLFNTPSRSDLVHDSSADGRHILFHTNTLAEQRRDLWYLERSEEGDWNAHPFADTEAEERVGVFSPNAEYVAYVSEESGRDEVYVRPFPAGPGKTQVSENGGTQPRWIGDELFYVETDTLFAAKVSTEDGFRVISTEKLFRDPRLVNFFQIQMYDASADGQRFVLVDPLSEGRLSTIHIVQNWYEEFRESE